MDQFPDLLKARADYQFYRPGGILYNRLFVQADQTLAVPALHWLQICWHLLNTVAAGAIVRQLGVGRWQALCVAALAGLTPFAFQAVAWAAPLQPLAAALQNGAWITYLIARQGGFSGTALNRPNRERQRIHQCVTVGASLLFFTAALAVQESGVSLSLVPLLLGWVVSKQHRRQVSSRILADRRGFPRDIRLALLYPLVGLIFGLIWLQAPRRSGIAGLGFEVPVLAFLLQGLVYPLLGRPGGYVHAATATPTILILLAIVTGGLLLSQAIRRGRGTLATAGLAWAVLGSLPALIGLPFSYVSLASRLFYFGVPGAALLWAGA